MSPLFTSVLLFIACLCEALLVAYAPTSWKKNKSYMSEIDNSKSIKCSTNVLPKNPKLLRLVQEYKELSSNVKAADLRKDLYMRVEGTKNIYNQRYLIFSTLSNTGMGNRLLPLISAFLLAILTKRILLVDFGYNLDELFCSPFEYDWQCPLDLRWSDIQRISRIITPIDESFQPAKLLKLDLQQQDSLDVKALTCAGNLQEYWNHVHILHIKSNKYFIPLIAANPAHSHFFIDDESISHELAMYLLQPKREFIKRIESLTKYIHPFTGVQYREFEYRVRSRELFKHFNYSNIYLSTIASNIRLNPHYNVTRASNDKQQEFTLNQAKQTIIDIWSLAQADELFITKKSTFGYMAMLLRGKKAYLLESGFEIGPEPCAHFQAEINTKYCQPYWKSTPQINIIKECIDTKGITL